MRPSGRAPDQMRAITHRARFHPPCRGIGADRLRRHQGAGHRERRGARAAVAARQGRGLGHRRIRHAAPRHPHPRQPRGGQGQAVGPHAGNPAADRPLAARRRRPEGARRAPDHARLRRDPGRWRHPHRLDLAAPGWRCASRSTGCSRAASSTADPIQQKVAAVSCGIYQGTPVLDLDYIEDSNADADANFVLTRRRQASPRRRRPPKARPMTRRRCCACSASPASAAPRSSRRRTRATGAMSGEGDDAPGDPQARPRQAGDRQPQ